MSRKEYYQKNKDRWKKYYQKRKTDPEIKKQYNETKKKWRHGVGKGKEKISKQKSDKKYHARKKQDPEYLQKRREAAREYNSRPEVKAHRKILNAKRRAKPEVKQRIAQYNQRWHKENPDKVLENTKRQLTKLGKQHNINWIKCLDQLRGWSEIIHKDCNETCQICGDKSDEAHHIFEKSKYPQLAFNRNNGIALCDLCHRQTHGKMLTKNNHRIRTHRLVRRVPHLQSPQ